MECAQGAVVKSLKGHDEGKLFVIVKSENGYLLLIDGKNRKKHNPKKKNPKHVEITNSHIPEFESLSDKKIRKQLNLLTEK